MDDMRRPGVRKEYYLKRERLSQEINYEEWMVESVKQYQQLYLAVLFERSLVLKSHETSAICS